MPTHYGCQAVNWNRVWCKVLRSLVHCLGHAIAGQPVRDPQTPSGSAGPVGPDGPFGPFMRGVAGPRRGRAGADPSEKCCDMSRFVALNRPASVLPACNAPLPTLNSLAKACTALIRRLPGNVGLSRFL